MDLSASSPAALPSPAHRALLLACFLAAALYLLQPLYLPRRAQGGSGPDSGSTSFAETAAMNQLARVAIGSKELAARSPGAARLIGPVESSIRQSEATVRTRQGLILRLVAYDALEMEEAKADIARRLSEEYPPEAPGAAPAEGQDLIQGIEALYLEGRPLSEAEVEAAGRRFGYVGRLVGLKQLRITGGPTEELEGSLRRSAVRFLTGFVLLIGVGLVLLATGGLLLAAALVQWRSGALEARYRTPVLPDWLHLESFTAYLFLMILGSVLGEKLPRPQAAPLLPAVLLQAALLGVALYPRLHGARWGEVRSDLGLTGGAGGWREALLGPVGYVASLPLVALGMAAALVLVRWTGQDVSEGMHPIVPLMKGEQASALNAAMALLVAVVMAPVLEEITFRGFFYGALRSRFRAGASILVSGAFFAGIHPQGLIGFPMLLAIGVTLAALREWRGSLIAPIVAHACTNGVTLMIVLLGF